MKIKIAFPDRETADAVCRILKPIGWESPETRVHRFFAGTGCTDPYPEGVLPTHSGGLYFHEAINVPEVSYEDLCAAVQGRLSISEVIDRAVARRRSER